MPDVWSEMMLEVVRSGGIPLEVPDGHKCPLCGAEVLPEDCGVLDSCEKCGWLGKLSKEVAP